MAADDLSPVPASTGDAENALTAREVRSALGFYVAEPHHGPGLRWTKRNEDKPHRCPSCHSVRTGDRKKWGPRTRITCPPCGLQWRIGNRSPRTPMWVRRLLDKPLQRTECPIVHPDGDTNV